MVDYSNQKPVMNPSYVKKPPTASQRKAGGQGGQGAALASNVAGASGQAGQDTFGVNKLKDTFNKGGVMGVLKQGASDTYNDISKPVSRIGSDLVSGTSALLFGQDVSTGTNQPKQVSIPTVSTAQAKPAPTVIQQPAVKSVQPTPTLGQFTTPEGGFAKVSISPNQPTNPNNSMGLHQLTPDQQTYLQNTIDRNARPEVRAEFARQAAIVDERRQKTAAWDAANSPNSPANLAAQSRNLFLNAMRTNNLGGIQEYGDLYKQESKNAVDYNQTNASLASGAMNNAVEQAKLGQSANLKLGDQSIEAQKHNDTVVQNYANWATDLSKGGMASPVTRLATGLKLGIIPDPALVFGADGLKELNSIQDPTERKNWLVEQLGPEGANQWIKSQQTQ
jgi:hypothetical protein